MVAVNVQINNIILYSDDDEDFVLFYFNKNVYTPTILILTVSCKNI